MSCSSVAERLGMSQPGVEYPSEVDVFEDKEARHVCLSFKGKIGAQSIEDAIIKVRKDIEKDNYLPEDWVLSVREVWANRDEETVFGYGSTPEAAKRNVLKKIPSDAFGLRPIEIIQRQEGAIEVQALSEREAFQLWPKNAPYNAVLDKMEFVIPPKKGFLGVGKRKGKWKVKWKNDFQAEARFKIPSLYMIEYIEKSKHRP